MPIISRTFIRACLRSSGTFIKIVKSNIQYVLQHSTAHNQAADMD